MNGAGTVPVLHSCELLTVGDCDIEDYKYGVMGYFQSTPYSILLILYITNTNGQQFTRMENWYSASSIQSTPYSILLILL